MAYNPVTSVPTNLVFFSWATPSNPNPRLAAPIDAVTTTLLFTSAPVDHNGDPITGGFIGGIRSTTSAYCENIYFPPGSISGTVATGVVRGVYLEGLDYTSGNTDLAIAAAQDSELFCDVSGVLQAINFAGLTGVIGANIKFNGRPLYVGNAPGAVPVFADATVRDATLTSPAIGDSCALISTGIFYDYAGGTWNARANGVNPNGSTTVAGKWQGATVADQIAATDVGTTGAELVPLNKNLKVTPSSSSDSGKIPLLAADGRLDPGTVPLIGLAYAADSGSTDAYVITLSPAATAYVTGMTIVFKANTANTGACTLNVNGLGAKTIKKDVSVDLADNDIVAGQLVAVTYDGTNFQIPSPQFLLNYSNGTTTFSSPATSSTQNIPHGLGRPPKRVRIIASAVTDAVQYLSQSFGTWDASGQNCQTFQLNSNVQSLVPALVSGQVLSLYWKFDINKGNSATVTVDATNIILTFTRGSTTGVSGNISWEAEG